MTDMEYQASKFHVVDQRGSVDASELEWAPGSRPPAYIGVDGFSFKFVMVLRDRENEVQGWLYMATSDKAPFEYAYIWND